MLYNDLLRLNAIDQDIQRHLEKLAVLYKDRSQIMKTQLTPIAEAMPTSVKVLYEGLSSKWEPVGVKVPSLKTLDSKLRAAFKLVAATREITEVPGLSVVLVPPAKILNKAMEHGHAPAVDIRSYRALQANQSNVWRVAVVQDFAGRQLVDNLESFLGEKPVSDALFQSRETSAQLVAAAYVQGVKMVERGSWSLLLADRTSLQEVPCARMVEGTLSFSIDDSAGFLGLNYYYPSLFVQGAGKHDAK